MLDLRFITRRSTLTKLAGGALLVMAVAPAQPLADSGFWPLRPSLRSQPTPARDTASAEIANSDFVQPSAGMIEIQQAKAEIEAGNVKPPMPSWLVDQPGGEVKLALGVEPTAESNPSQPTWLDLADYQSEPSRPTTPNPVLQTGQQSVPVNAPRGVAPSGVAKSSGFFPKMRGGPVNSAQMNSALVDSAPASNAQASNAQGNSTQRSGVQPASPRVSWLADGNTPAAPGSTPASGGTQSTYPSQTTSSSSNKPVRLDFNQPPALARSTTEVDASAPSGQSFNARRSFFPSPARPTISAPFDPQEMIAQDKAEESAPGNTAIVIPEAVAKTESMESIASAVANRGQSLPPVVTSPAASKPTVTLPANAFAEASPTLPKESGLEPPASASAAKAVAPILAGQSQAVPEATASPTQTPSQNNALAGADRMVLPPIEAPDKSSVQFADLVSDTQQEDLGVNQVATFDLINQDSYAPDWSPSDRVAANQTEAGLPASDVSDQQQPIAIPPVEASQVTATNPNDLPIGSQAISAVDTNPSAGGTGTGQAAYGELPAGTSGRPRILFQPAVPARDASGRSILRPNISVASMIGQDQGAESVVEIIEASQSESGSVLELPMEESQDDVLWIPAPLRDHSLPVRQRAWRLVRSAARALKTKPRYDAGVGQERLAFALFEMDAAQPNNNFRIRTQAAYNWEFPDRAEYLWSRIGGKGPGVSIPPETSVDFQDLRLAMEVGGARFSMTTEIPLRFINPTSTQNTGGMGDMVTVAKTLMMDKERFKLSQVLLTQMPTGTASKGRGNGHVSMEPGFVSSFAWTDRTIINNGLKLWFPLGGEPGFSGPVLRYGAGFAHLWYDSDQFAIIPTFEIVGWSALNGQKTNEFGLQETYDGENILNLYPGLRLVSDRSASGTVFEVGLNGGFTITDRHWYDKIIRLDARWTF